MEREIPLPGRTVETKQRERPMQTKMLRMPRMRLNTTLLYLYGWVPIASLALLAIPALMAGIFHDIRWLIVFLMICFIFSPMLMAFLYFYHGMRPSTSSNAALHRFSFEPDGIKITVYSERDDIRVGEDREKDKKNLPEGEVKPEESDVKHLRSETVLSERESEAEYRPLHTMFYPYAAVKEISMAPNSVILRLANPYGGFLWLPYDAFSDSDLFTKSLHLIRTGINQIKPAE